MNKRRISVQDLQIGMYVAELDRPWLGTPFLFQGFPIISVEQIEVIKKVCRNVFVDIERDASDGGMRGMGIQGIRGAVVYPEIHPVERELAVAKEVFAAVQAGVEKTLEAVRVKGEFAPKLLTEAIGSMTRSIQRNPDAMLLLFRIQKKSGEELNRAVDAAIHMATFGRFLQFSTERLELLGLAGLLLDIGKTALPDAIVNKTGILTPEEYELSKSHVVHSADIVGAVAGLPKGLGEIVLQHHERQDGSGYPRSLRGRQITIDGAIAGMVNSYCAITSKRSYTEQESPSNALNKLYEARGGLFHKALVEQFIQCIGIYPVGSIVELNTGEVGIVIAQNLVRRLQPRVMVVLDALRKPIRPEVILDLVKEPKNTKGDSYQIRRTLPRDGLPINFAEYFLN